MNYYNKECECMGEKDKKELQSKRLIKLVNYVYDNVAFYKDKMDKMGVKPSDIKSIDDIVKLPFTDKQDLRDSYPYGMLACSKTDIKRVHASSGTTGKPTIIAYTQNDLDVWSECMARAYAGIGATVDSTIQVSYGYGLFTGGLGAHYGSEKFGAVTIPASTGNTKKQILLMKDLGVDVICCTPTYALHMAEQIKAEGFELKDLNLKKGLFGAEPWGNNLRKQVEENLGIDAYDVYGLSEISGPGVGAECEFKAGSHIQDDHFYPEIINSETLEVLPYGSEGELVFTTLTKTGMPLIRYRTHDVTSLNNKPCKCGRTSVRITGIKGRTDDMLIIKGINVYPSQIENVLSKCPYLTKVFSLEVVKNGVFDDLVVKIEVRDSDLLKDVNLTSNLIRKLGKELLSALNIKVIIELMPFGSVQNWKKIK